MLLGHEGVPMEDIQQWKGHSTITTTESIYTHFENKQHLNAANKLVGTLTVSADTYDKIEDDSLASKDTEDYDVLEDSIPYNRKQKKSYMEM